MISFLNDWLKTAPPSSAVFFAAVLSFAASLVVASIGFITVLYQNKRENARLAAKLEHETGLKCTERAMQMKREAFLLVGEAMAAAADYLARFADLSLPREKHQESIRQVAAKVHCVHIIASQETLDALINFYEDYVEYVLELEVLRLPVLMKQDEVARADRSANEMNEASRVLVNRLTDLRRNGAESSALLLAAQEVQILMHEANQASTRQVALREELAPVHLNLAAKALECSLKLGKLNAKAVVAMRRELGFPIDAQAYESRLEESRNRTLQHFRSCMKHAQEVGAAAISGKGPGVTPESAGQR